ncbi:MAG TPA: R3H domain-containing nucleic acid-binding protein [Anaerolineaceae bacterium]|nr:R3H domain-containing nucleic acid-binding protein [Anaerolineaceae bacterium]
MTQKKITDDLQALMEVLPPEIAKALDEADNSDNLIEIVMDLGRTPKARFVDEEVPLSDLEITHDEIDFVVKRIGNFDADNRAGLERTLHRISGIRNRRGQVVGLTSRVGRAVYGTIDIIEDLIESEKSVLLLGKPGIGKTTMLREAARILAEKKRVVIVDTSNEIGGDGDVPHPAVGNARRMQVAKPSLQHEVMIEAVENHNPEVIVIDEIGRELEALAARTIAERGVQLIATAHGRTLENLLLNPTLSDLIGGIESVTLSDEEARRRGTQKTVLERRSPPTFDILVEIQERSRMAVHSDVSEAVDSLLRGYPLPPEIRYRNDKNEIKVEKLPAPSIVTRGSMAQGMRRSSENGRSQSKQRPVPYQQPELSVSNDPETGRLRTFKIFPYGVARNRLEQAAKRLSVPAVIVRSPEEADLIMTLRTYYRSRQQVLIEAEDRGTPLYFLRSNTINQMEKTLIEIYNLNAGNFSKNDEWQYASQVTEDGIRAVLNGQRWADLPPASSAIRHLQHEMARQAQLVSHSYGKDPNRRVRIFRE